MYMPPKSLEHRKKTDLKIKFRNSGWGKVNSQITISVLLRNRKTSPWKI